MQHAKGYTLVEILTAVVIVTILVSMAVPLYEKTIERSRLAEARTVLAKLQDAKLQAMDAMGCRQYDANNDSCPKLRHLNMGVTGTADNDLSFDTDAFHFSLVTHAGRWRNAVCARRTGGDGVGTVFVYAAAGVTAEGSPAQFQCMGASCQSIYGLGEAGLSIRCL